MYVKIPFQSIRIFFLIPWGSMPLLAYMYSYCKLIICNLNIIIDQDDEGIAD